MGCGWSYLFTERVIATILNIQSNEDRIEYPRLGSSGYSIFLDAQIILLLARLIWMALGNIMSVNGFLMEQLCYHMAFAFKVRDNATIILLFALSYE